MGYMEYDIWDIWKTQNGIYGTRNMGKMEHLIWEYETLNMGK